MLFLLHNYQCLVYILDIFNIRSVIVLKNKLSECQCAMWLMKTFLHLVMSEKRLLSCLTKRCIFMTIVLCFAHWSVRMKRERGPVTFILASRAFATLALRSAKLEKWRSIKSLLSVLNVRQRGPLSGSWSLNAPQPTPAECCAANRGQSTSIWIHYADRLAGALGAELAGFMRTCG